LGDLRAVGKIILIWILKLYDFVDMIHLAGYCGHSNEPTGSAKGREYLV
jgi:hypothetical protein